MTVHYDVQYNSYLSSIYPNLPVVNYRYKKSGKALWERKETVVIDDFASRYWKNEYYNEFVAYERRIYIIKEVIDKEYNGSLESYIRAMVRFEIMSDLINKGYDPDAQEIAISLVTDGWKSTEVELYVDEDTPMKA